MNTEDGALSFGTAVDLQGLESGITQIEAKIAAMESRMNTKIDGIGKAVSKTNGEIKASMQGISSEGVGLSNVLGNVAKAAASIGVAFTAQSLIRQIVNVRGEFQQLEVAFKTMLGSEEQATELMGQLLDTAAKTPFDLQSISNGARQLLAYGENVNNVNDDLIRLGNIAAGLSQPLNDLVYLYGTTMTQGRLYTQDLNQFTGRGIPMIRELANVLGVAESKVKDLVEEGKVGFPEVQKVIQNLTNEGGMFYNLMEEQSRTITGQISNIEDAISSMLNEIGKQSEGIINSSLNVVSSLIENYEQVGRVLLGLVATYGVYRTACMAVAAAHALQAAGIGALTAAEAIHYGWLVVVEKAQKLLNATMLANPYVLVATLIAGVAVALISMKNETERMKEAEEEYQAQKQKTIEAEEEHKRKIEELCSIAGDEAVATDTRREALNKLEMKYPDIFAKYDTEYEKLKNIKKIKQEIAELEAGQSITVAKNELATVEARISELQKKKATERWEEANASGTKMRKVGGLSKDEEAELNNLLNKRKNLSSQVRKDDVNAYFENLTGISNETLEQQIKQRKTLLATMQMQEKQYGTITKGNERLTGTFSRDELQYQLNKLQSEQNRRNQKTSSSSEWGASAKKEYEKALKEYNDFLADTSNSLTQEDYEKKAKELKDALSAAKKAYDATKPSENKDASKQKKQAEKEEQEEKRRAEKKRKLGQELVQIEQETKEAEVETMEEGLAKKLAMIDLEYTQQKNKLEKQKSDWKKENQDAGLVVNANGLTQEQDDALTKAQEQNEEKKRIATEKALKEEADMQSEAMNNYYIKYGNLQEKILALTEEYSRKIRDAKTKGDTLSLKKELEDAISNVKLDNLKNSIDWEAVFGNIGEQSISSLQYALDKIKSVDTSSMNVSDIKDLQEAMDKIEDEIASRNPFTALAKSLQDISKYKEEFVDALNKYAEAQRELTAAQSEYNAALEYEQQLKAQIEEGTLSEDSETYKDALNATAEAQNKLNQATEKSNKAEQNALKARNNITVSYKNFASQLKSVNTVIKDVASKASNLASVFSDDVADSIDKSIGFLSEMLDAASTVIDAIGDTGKSVASAMQTTAQATGSAVQGTATATTAAISTVEKASVILAVISAALQIATAIANLFNDDDEKQEEIERLQERIDQLQWELDNADAVRLQENTGDALQRLKNILAETQDEVLKLHLTTDQYYSKWYKMIGQLIYQNEIYEKSIQKIADAYASVSYTADKALGENKYKDARAQLENLAEQQILLQKQINEESSKKHSDSGQIAEWQQQIQENAEEMATIINEMLEDIIGYTAENLASELGDAFFEAVKQGEDAMEAWKDKVDDIVADILQRMLIQKYLEEPIGAIFDKYKTKWFGSDGSFQGGIQTVIDSMGDFANDLNMVGTQFEQIWESLPDTVTDWFSGDEERQGTEKGIATASQDSVDENNARLTTIQGHTYSISQGVVELNRTGNAMLEKLTGIEENTSRMNDKLDDMNDNIKNIRSDVGDIQTKGIKVRT
jgi:tape measure domain-containing protein